MSTIRRPCSDCGELTTATKCEECARASARRQIRERVSHSKKANSTQRGYDTTWRKLSERARRLQPFCSDCGATTDLQADHSPEAWERYEKGLEIRLTDIEVVCGNCNRKRGAARGDNTEKRSHSDSKRLKPFSGTHRPTRKENGSESLTANLGGIPKPHHPRPFLVAPSQTELMGNTNNGGCLLN